MEMRQMLTVEKYSSSRSNYQRCSIKKSVRKNLAIFTGNHHLCQSLFLNKVAGLRPATLFKKETLVQVFSCEICEAFKITFLTEQIWVTASLAAPKCLC